MYKDKSDKKPYGYQTVHWKLRISDDKEAVTTGDGRMRKCQLLILVVLILGLCYERICKAVNIFI
jgi:hypothetical protein